MKINRDIFVPLDQDQMDEALEIAASKMNMIGNDSKSIDDNDNKNNDDNNNNYNHNEEEKNPFLEDTPSEGMTRHELEELETRRQQKAKDRVIHLAEEKEKIRQEKIDKEMAIRKAKKLHAMSRDGSSMMSATGQMGTSEGFRDDIGDDGFLSTFAESKIINNMKDESLTTKYNNRMMMESPLSDNDEMMKGAASKNNNDGKMTPGKVKRRPTDREVMEMKVSQKRIKENENLARKKKLRDDKIANESARLKSQQDKKNALLQIEEEKKQKKINDELLLKQKQQEVIALNKKKTEDKLLITKQTSDDAELTNMFASVVVTNAIDTGSRPSSADNRFKPITQEATELVSNVVINSIVSNSRSSTPVKNSSRSSTPIKVAEEVVSTAIDEARKSPLLNRKMK